jgi:hypothetical protein
MMLKCCLNGNAPPFFCLGGGGVDGGRFWKHMLPAMPIISFGPQGGQFEQVRRQEPILFLSMIAAAASTLRIPDMFEKLQKEAISVITYNAVVEGQKTGELLLSLLVLTFWPMAPARYIPPSFTFYESPLMEV